MELIILRFQLRGFRYPHSRINSIICFEPIDLLHREQIGRKFSIVVPPPSRSLITWPASKWPWIISHSWQHIHLAEPTSLPI